MRTFVFLHCFSFLWHHGFDIFHMTIYIVYISTNYDTSHTIYIILLALYPCIVDIFWTKKVAKIPYVKIIWNKVCIKKRLNVLYLITHHRDADFNDYLDWVECNPHYFLILMPIDNHINSSFRFSMHRRVHDQISF